MHSFTQFDEDSYRLPEGVKRIAYDADTERYTFRDRSGQLYQNSPGENYGNLIAISTPLPRRRRVTVTELRDPRLHNYSNSPAKTFGDILPSDYITSPIPLADSQPTQSSSYPDESSKDKFVRAVRQSALPKMQGVVGDVLRRSKTSLRRHASRMSERQPLLGNDNAAEKGNAGEKPDTSNDWTMIDAQVASYSTLKPAQRPQPARAPYRL
ncbi:hypothetical protein BJ138DRAFT_164523 [Hygrophoropsis aurantiaca]|uniref:Uncharacterized protein n=1 Tax=Hygrophoropsis aurantiaca TaxID=72124 RepID=A0ACB7ZQG3_9AGAM|nr:hypothetical protein BJ138DRAFT_164523 [Hygrophoropsis aurantiaca]